MFAILRTKQYNKREEAKYICRAGRDAATSRPIPKVKTHLQHTVTSAKHTDIIYRCVSFIKTCTRGKYTVCVFAFVGTNADRVCGFYLRAGWFLILFPLFVMKGAYFIGNKE
jgi:hypothetical protein